MKKSVVALAAVVVIGAVVYSQRANIAMRIMAKGAEIALSTDTIANLEDGLHLHYVAPAVLCPILNVPVPVWRW
jgi:ribonuclease Z